MSHLYAVSRHDVEAARIDREPADCLCGVDDGHRPVLGRHVGDRVEIRHLAGRHLHGAEHDHVHVGTDLTGKLARRNEADRDAALLLDEERKEQRCELDVGREHA